MYQATPYHLKRALKNAKLQIGKLAEIQPDWAGAFDDNNTDVLGEFALAWHLLGEYLKSPESLKKTGVITGLVGGQLTHTFAVANTNSIGKGIIIDFGTADLEEYDIAVSPESYLQEFEEDWERHAMKHPFIKEESVEDFLKSYWHQDNWVEAFDSLFQESDKIPQIWDTVNDQVKRFFALI